MGTVPFTVLPSLQARAVDVTLFGTRGSIIAVASFSEAEARELQRLIGVALYQLSTRAGAR